MELVAIVTVLAIIQAVWFAIEVGMARVRYGVEAPACSGHPAFDRAYRVHENSVEQLVLFLPALWISGYYLHQPTAAALGLLFILGRFVFRSAYRRDPRSRNAGFGIGMLSIGILGLGGFVGAVMRMVA